MRTGNSKKRELFEEEYFPYLDVLWRTARCLTNSDGLAEDLVENTMTRAYSEWSYSSDLIDNKTWLFKILTREFLGFGKEKQKPCHPEQYLPDEIRVAADAEGGNPQNADTAIQQLKHLAENGFLDKTFRGIMARVGPKSRLILSLLYIGEFSYADIAFIMDLSKNSVRVILARVRKLMSKCMLEYLECLDKNAKSQRAFIRHSTEFDSARKSVSLNVPFIFALEAPAKGTFDGLENKVDTGAKQDKE